MLGSRVIAYYPDLAKILGSMTSAILMQQMEYWFKHTKNKKFYKFLEPCNNPSYSDGDSWTEELGVSKAEFRTAFSKIGVSYKSKKEFDSQEDKFQNMYYCCYTDRLERKTYYFRNNDLVKELKAELNKEEDEKPQLESSSPRSKESELLEVKKVDFYKSRKLISNNKRLPEDYQKNHEHDSIDIFDNLFKEFGINYTKTNQASVKRLLKTMSESEVITYLKETCKALSENKDIKNLAGAFSKKIAEGIRQVNPKPKKVEVPVVESKVISGKRSTQVLGEQDLIDSMTLEEREHKELEAKVYEVVKSNAVLKKAFYKATMTLEKLKKFVIENNIEL